MKSAILVFMLALCPFALKAEEAPSVSQHAYALINADKLKTLYDTSAEMVVLDARTGHYFDGTTLPGAKWITAESTEEAILAAAPKKDGLVVVYCVCTKCPAGAFLADKLVAMGYTNVNKYPEGIQEWIEKGYPTVKQ